MKYGIALAVLVVLGLLINHFVVFDIQELPCTGGQWKVRKIVHPEQGLVSAFTMFPGVELSPESCLAIDNETLLATIGCPPNTVNATFTLHDNGLKFTYQDQVRITDTLFTRNDTMRFLFNRYDVYLTRE